MNLKSGHKASAKTGQQSRDLIKIKSANRLTTNLTKRLFRFLTYQYLTDRLSVFDNKVGYFSCLLSLVLNVYKYEYAPLQDTIKMFTADLLTLVSAFAIILHAFAYVD